MSTKMKAVVYPYNEDFASQLRYWFTESPYEITHLVSPIGFRLAGNDASFADRSPALGMAIEDDFEAAILDADVVILCDVSDHHVKKHTKTFDKSSAIGKLMLEKAHLAIGKGKHVLSMVEWEDSIERTLREDARLRHVQYTSCRDLASRKMEERVLGLRNTTPRVIPVPVVFVMGTGCNTDKFMAQLGLVSGLRALGLKVGWVGSRPYAGLWGGYPIPGFMASGVSSEEEKVRLFNNYVYEVAQAGGMDVVVVGIPGGVIPICREFPNRYGLTAILMSQAVIPDYTLWTHYYNTGENQEFMDNLLAAAKHRCNAIVNAFHISRRVVNIGESKQKVSLVYEKYTDEEVDNHKAELLEFLPTVYNLHRPEDMEQWVRQVVDTLSAENHAEVLNWEGEMTNVYADEKSSNV